MFESGPVVTMAFQPIVDASNGELFAYEALARPQPVAGQEPGCASDVFSRVEVQRLGEFDEACRELAIRAAARLGITGFLALNFMPDLLEDPRASLRRSLAVAASVRMAPPIG